MRLNAKIFLASAFSVLLFGSIAAPTQNAFAADTQRPSVSFSNPSGGATLSGTVNVKVLASDNVKVGSVKLTVGWNELVGIQATAPYEYSLDTKKFNNGNHMLRAYALDSSGNARESRIYVTIDNPVPLPPTAEGDWNLVVYPIKNDDYTKSVVAKHASVTSIINFRLGLLEKYPNEQHMLLTESHEAIRNGIAEARQTGVRLDYVVYDNERSNYNLSTPESELVNPAASTNQAMDIIHNAGLKAAICPTRSLLKEEMSGVQWSKVDLVVLQMQKVVGVAEFYDLTTKVAQLARPQNPDIIIIVQVSPALASNAEIIESVKKVKPYINGVQVLWNLENDAVLDDLLTRLENM